MNKYSDLLVRNKLLKLAIEPNILSPGDDSLLFMDYTPRGGNKLKNFSLSPEPRNVFANRPVHSEISYGISPISELHNHEQIALSSKYFTRSEKKIKLPKLTHNSPTSKDFTELLAKIESVVSPKSRQNMATLKEDEPHTQSQESNTPFYFKIITKGKKSPLCVRIKKYIGKIVVYFSYTNAHPSPSNFDKVFNSSYFEVSDYAFDLKAEQMHLGVHCNSECQYKIEVSFGKIKSLTQLKRIPKDSEGEGIERMANKESSIEKNKNNEKNFVKANMDVGLQLSIMRLKDFESQHLRWVAKRKEVINRKKTLIFEKKQKAIESLNRRARRLEREMMAKEEMEKMVIMIRLQETFITLCYFFHSLETIKDAIQTQRRIIFTRIKLNLKAALIQRAFRAHLKIPNDKHCVVLASTCLLLYKRNTMHMFTKKSSLNIMKAILNKAKANLLVHQIGNFGIKVLKIQRLYRRYLLKKRLRMKKLHEMWRRCIDKIMFSKKSNRSKKRESMKYKAIPSGAKNRILNNYYLECWKAFELNMREYLKSRYSKDKIFQTELDAPHLQYLPTENAMRDMIRSFLNSAKT